MKKRIIYLIGTIVFLAVFAFTVQFVGNGADENNNLAVKNLEALAGGTAYCSKSCFPELNACCCDCWSCAPEENTRPENPVYTCLLNPQ